MLGYLDALFDAAFFYQVYHLQAFQREVQLVIPRIDRKSGVDLVDFLQRLLDFTLPYQVLDFISLFDDRLVHFRH